MLTDKQVRALSALAEPDSAMALLFWAEARVSWPGPRKTLGSLIARGLANYSDEGVGGHWSITDAGRAELEAEAKR